MISLNSTHKMGINCLFIRNVHIFQENIENQVCSVHSFSHVCELIHRIWRCIGGNTQENQALSLYWDRTHLALLSNLFCCCCVKSLKLEVSYDLKQMFCYTWSVIYSSILFCFLTFVFFLLSFRIYENTLNC